MEVVIKNLRPTKEDGIWRFDVDFGGLIVRAWTFSEKTGWIRKPRVRVRENLWMSYVSVGQDVWDAIYQALDKTFRAFGKVVKFAEWSSEEAEDDGDA